MHPKTPRIRTGASAPAVGRQFGGPSPIDRWRPSRSGIVVARAMPLMPAFGNFSPAPFDVIVERGTELGDM